MEMSMDSILVNSRNTQIAQEAFNRLPKQSSARTAHAGLADPVGYALERSRRRALSRVQRKLEAAKAQNRGKKWIDHFESRLASLSK
jgi:hypothetical protein